MMNIYGRLRQDIPPSQAILRIASGKEDYALQSFLVEIYYLELELRELRINAFFN